MNSRLNVSFISLSVLRYIKCNLRIYRADETSMASRGKRASDVSLVHLNHFKLFPALCSLSLPIPHCCYRLGWLVPAHPLESWVGVCGSLVLVSTCCCLPLISAAALMLRWESSWWRILGVFVSVLNCVLRACWLIYEN